MDKKLFSKATTISWQSSYVERPTDCKILRTIKAAAFALILIITLTVEPTQTVAPTSPVQTTSPAVTSSVPASPTVAPEPGSDSSLATYIAVAAAAIIAAVVVVALLLKIRAK